MARFPRAAFLSVVSLVVLVLAACGGNGDDDPAPTVTATATNPGSSSPTATATTTSPGGILNPFGGACTAIGMVGGFATGVDITTEPSSDFAHDVSDYFQPLIVDALGSAETACFLEFEEDGELSLYIEYELSSDPPADAAGRLADALIADGISEDDVSSFSTSMAGTAFSGVNATNIDALGEFSSSDVVLFVSNRSVVLAVSRIEDSGDNDTPVPGGPTPTPEALVPDSTVVATGAAATADTAIRSTLEAAFGVQLNLTGEFSMSSSGLTSVSLSYQTANGAIIDNGEAALQEAVQALGGTVDLALSSGGTVLVNFSGLSLGGLAYQGNMTVEDASVVLTLLAQ